MDAALRLVTARLFDQGYWWSLSGGWTRTLDGNPIPHTPPGAPANPPVLNEFHNAGTALVLPTNLFYGGGASRTVVDPNPPVEAVDALAAVFLPGCSEFQVEYTYDNPRELLVNGGGVILTGFELGTVAAQPIRWESVPAGEVRVWSRLPVDPSEYSPEADNAPNRLNMTFPFRWPRALRVSIRVWDPGNRLSEPLTRTIIHVFDS